MRRDLNRRLSPAVARKSLFQWRRSTLHIEGKALGPCPFSHLRLACVAPPQSNTHKKFCSGRSGDWMAPEGRDFGQRFQHKASFRNSGMRQDETGTCSCSRCSAQNQSAVVENIKIEGSRTPTDSAPAAGGALDRMKPREQCLRRKMSFDGGDGVDEIRLVRPAKRRRFNQLRCRDKSEPVAVQFTKCPLDSLTWRPPWPCHIRSQRYKYHDCA